MSACVLPTAPDRRASESIQRNARRLEVPRLAWRRRCAFIALRSGPVITDTCTETAGTRCLVRVAAVNNDKEAGLTTSLALVTANDNDAAVRVTSTVFSDVSEQQASESFVTSVTDDNEVSIA